MAPALFAKGDTGLYYSLSQDNIALFSCSPCERFPFEDTPLLELAGNLEIVEHFLPLGLGLRFR